MKIKILEWLPILVAVSIIAASIAIGAATIRTGEEESLRFTRACFFPEDGWTIVNCSNAAAATSTDLGIDTRIVVQCTDDSYINFGTSGLADADANDGYLPNGEWLEHGTMNGSRYFSCLNVNADNDCRWIECQ